MRALSPRRSGAATAVAKQYTKRWPSATALGEDKTEVEAETLLLNLCLAPTAQV